MLEECLRNGGQWYAGKCHEREVGECGPEGKDPRDRKTDEMPGSNPEKTRYIEYKCIEGTWHSSNQYELDISYDPSKTDASTACTSHANPGDCYINGCTWNGGCISNDTQYADTDMPEQEPGGCRPGGEPLKKTCPDDNEQICIYHCDGKGEWEPYPKIKYRPGTEEKIYLDPEHAKYASQRSAIDIEYCNRNILSTSALRACIKKAFMSDSGDALCSADRMASFNKDDNCTEHNYRDTKYYCCEQNYTQEELLGCRGNPRKCEAEAKEFNQYILIDTLILDNDGDGIIMANDCDDNDPNRFPGNYEIGGDFYDSDCDSFDWPVVEDPQEFCDDDNDPECVEKMLKADEQGLLDIDFLPECIEGSEEFIYNGCARKVCISGKWIVMRTRDAKCQVSVHECEKLGFTRAECETHYLSDEDLRKEGIHITSCENYVEKELCTQSQCYWDVFNGSCYNTPYSTGSKTLAQIPSSISVGICQYGKFVTYAFDHKKVNKCLSYAYCSGGNVNIELASHDDYCYSKYTRNEQIDELCSEDTLGMTLQGKVCRYESGRYLFVEHITENPPCVPGISNIIYDKRGINCFSYCNSDAKWIKNAWCEVPSSSQMEVYEDIDRDGSPGRFILDSQTFRLDCDDNNSEIYPGNPEVFDQLDNDCNGKVDDLKVVTSAVEINTLAQFEQLLEAIPCRSHKLVCASEVFPAKSREEIFELDTQLGSLECVGEEYQRYRSDSNLCNPAKDDYYLRATGLLNDRANVDIHFNNQLLQQHMFKCKTADEISNGKCRCNNTLDTQEPVRLQKCMQKLSSTISKDRLFDNCSDSLLGECSQRIGYRCAGQIKRNGVWVDNYEDDVSCENLLPLGISIDPTDVLVSVDEIKEIEELCGISLISTQRNTWTQKGVKALKRVCNHTLLDTGLGKYLEDAPITLTVDRSYAVGGGTWGRADYTNNYMQLFDTTQQGNIELMSDLQAHEFAHLLDGKRALINAKSSIDKTNEFVGNTINAKYASVDPNGEWLEKTGWECSDLSNGNWRNTCSHPCEGDSSGCTKEAPPTWYAATNPVEDFAESFTGYFQNPGSFCSQYPIRCEFIETNYTHSLSDPEKNPNSWGCYDDDASNDVNFDCSLEGRFGYEEPSPQLNYNNLNPVSKAFAQTESSADNPNLPTIHLEGNLPDQSLFTSGGETVHKLPGQRVKLFGYYDTNGNKKFDLGERITDPPENYQELIETQPAKTYKLTTGWHMISVPLQIPDFTASKLLYEITKAEGYATTVAKYEGGKWKSYKIRGDQVFSDEDFMIEPGVGYMVKILDPAVLTLSGEVPKDPAEMDLSSGWNLVGFDPGQNGWDSAELLKILRQDGIDADIISEWENGRYNHYIRRGENVYGWEFEIWSTKGYFIRVKGK